MSVAAGRLDYVAWGPRVILPDVDDSLWPLVISVLPPKVTPRFVERFFQKQDELLDRGQDWLHIVDSRSVRALPCSETRAGLARHLKRTGERSTRYTKGTALLHASSLMRGIVTALHWVQPPAYAFANVSTTEEALSYLVERARSNVIVLPFAATPELVDGVVARINQLRDLLDQAGETNQVG